MHVVVICVILLVLCIALLALFACSYLIVRERVGKPVFMPMSTTESTMHRRAPPGGETTGGETNFELTNSVRSPVTPGNRYLERSL